MVIITDVPLDDVMRTLTLITFVCLSPLELEVEQLDSRNLEGARDPIVRLKFGAGVSLHAKMANERPAPPAASLP